MSKSRASGGFSPETCHDHLASDSWISRNFADETLRVGRFTVIVGANASGKSNIRDAFRFLHGIGRGYTLAEIIGGKYGAGGQGEWNPIRGAADEIIRFGREAAFGLGVNLKLGNEDATYSIEVGPELRTAGFRITYERLRIDQQVIYEKPRNGYGDDYVVLDNGENFYIKTGPAGVISASESRQPWWRYKDLARPVIDTLHSMRFPGTVAGPNAGRRPFPALTVLGDSGENLPVVLEDVCADPKRKDVLAAWCWNLLPWMSRISNFHGTLAVESTSRSWRPMGDSYRPTALRTAPCAFSPCWQCCSATIPRVSISLRRSTQEFTRHGYGFCSI